MKKKRVALVLGGTGDIGGAIADNLQNDGIIVARHGRSGDFAASIENEGELEKMIKNVLSQFGHIDILVNSISARLDIRPASKKTWLNFSNQLESQLKASVLSLPLILPMMRQGEFGRIINILSATTCGELTSGLSDYTSAKYALLGFTKSIALELGRFGITVNAVSPGFVKNRLTEAMPEKARELVEMKTPTGRLTTAADVASLVSYLVSEEAGQITGANVAVAGGINL